MFERSLPFIMHIKYSRSSDSAHRRHLIWIFPPQVFAYFSTPCPWQDHFYLYRVIFFAASSWLPPPCCKSLIWFYAAGETFFAHSESTREFHYQVFFYPIIYSSDENYAYKKLTWTTLVSFSRLVSRGTSRST